MAQWVSVFMFQYDIVHNTLQDHRGMDLIVVEVCWMWKSVVFIHGNFISDRMDKQVSGIEWQRPLKNAVSAEKCG